jgi:hypothetical protein
LVTSELISNPLGSSAFDILVAPSESIERRRVLQKALDAKPDESVSIEFQAHLKDFDQ